VKTSSSKTITLEMGALGAYEFPLSDLKEMIKRMEGIPIGMQHLFAGGKELKENKPAKFYELDKGNLTLVVRPFEEEIKSPFPDQRVLLSDPKRLFSDVDLVIPGLKEPVHLHRNVIFCASDTFKDLLSSNFCAYGKYDEASHCITWTYDCSDDEIYRTVLMKFLHFCYGESVILGPAEYAAAHICLTQLQLEELVIHGSLEMYKVLLEERMVHDSAADYKTGLLILGSCLKYKIPPHLCEEVARAVMTPANITAHTEEIEDFLMHGPSCLLDWVGCEPGYKKIQLCIKYLKANPQLSEEEKKRIILTKCKIDQLDMVGLIALRNLHILSDSELLDLVETSLKK